MTSIPSLDDLDPVATARGSDTCYDDHDPVATARGSDTCYDDLDPDIG